MPLQEQQAPAMFEVEIFVHAAEQVPVDVVLVAVNPYVGSTEARSLCTE
jgi:hypothetical protein